MRAALNDDPHPPRFLRARLMLACNVCGWVHYAMSASEKAESNHALERYNLSAAEREPELMRAASHFITPVLIDHA